MFTYDVSVTFILEKCVITTGVRIDSDNSDFEIDEEVAIDGAIELLESDGLDYDSVRESVNGIDLQVQGLYGGF